MFCFVLVLLSGCRSEVLQGENNDDDDYDDEVEEEEEEGGEEEEGNEEGEEDGDDREEVADDDGDEEEEEEEEAKRMKETEQDTEDRNELKSINTNERQRGLNEQEIAMHRRETSVNADGFETTGTNSAKLRYEIDSLKNKHCSKLTTRCYQLKLTRTTDVDYEEIIRNFNESEIMQPVLDNIKLIEDQWKTLDLWEILQSVNPRPLMKFDRDELLKHDSTLLGNNEDMIFRWSIVLCSILSLI